MPASADAVRKAREYSQRKFAIEMENVAKQGNEELAAERNRQAAMGSVQSGSMWKFVADHLAKRIEALMRAKLTATLEGYDPYKVPFDEEAERELLQDIRSMREAQITNAVNFAAAQPWLGSQATSYISGRLTSISSFQNEAKVEIEERRHKQQAPSTQVGSNGSLVFVSCGQSTASERDLGKSIARLVEAETGCDAYFAENQTTLEGVTENILKKLNEAVAFIAIMHPRGNVSNPHNPSAPSWVRGSVWVEQEVAIAAFISQALQRPMKVRCYVHQTIFREGLRDKLHLNPVLFDRDEDIVADLTEFLPTWRALAQHHHKRGLSLRPAINHRRVNIPGGSSDKDDERHMLLATVENDGEEEARGFRLDVEFPSAFVDESGHVLQVQASKQGYVTYRVANTHRKIDHFYPGEKAPEDLIAFHYVVHGTIKREHPELLQQLVIATVYSGNMQPNRITKTIAELLG